MERGVLTVDAEVLANEARRRAVALVLRAHPEWTLARVFRGSEELLDSVMLQDLWGANPRRASLFPTRLERATDLHGHEFDELMLEVIREAGGPVKHGYLCAHLGGPRWKLQKALTRLCSRGLISRKGATSDTCYQASGPPVPSKTG